MGRGKQEDRKTGRQVYMEETEVGRREGCIVTGGVQKREGHLYIVIDTQVGGAHEDPALTHNLVKVSQVIDPVLNDKTIVTLR